MRYRVAYATGSRADYGIVRHYLEKLNNNPIIDFSVLVTGSHLDSRFGNSVDIIKSDGYHIAFEAPLEINNTTNSGILSSMSIALRLFGDFFEKNKYDLLIVLGDRYEMMAVTIAAAMQRIPILHLHGGEITYGNYDEFIRHSITKMSTYHFTSTEEYRKRVIQMGENPERVFYLGALGAENCKTIDMNNIDSVVNEMVGKSYFVVAFHPETLTDVNLEDQVQTVLQAITPYVGKYKFVFIGTNADTGSSIIRDTWVNFANRFSENIKYVENLNADSYLYLIKNSVALIGNSSSGIIEAPSLGVQTINIGNRQRGRVAGESVITIPCIKTEILSAIARAIAVNKEGRQFANPYYTEDTAERYYKTTLTILEKGKQGVKEFYDL